MLASSTGTDTGVTTDASSTIAGGIFGLNDPSLSSPASSTIDTSSWLTYSNASSNYSIRYPANLSVNTDASGDLVLAFPKDQYFHWPLLDSATVTITATSSCQTVEGSTFPGSPAPVSFQLNGYPFTRIEGGDAAAGNIYRELAYDVHSKSLCYHIDILDHGANGAGLYVADQSLISSYDAAHTIDLTAVLGVFNAMVNTFRFSQSVL